MVIPQMLGNSAHRPRAATLQRRVETVDDVLVGLARAQHVTVAWWWGIRKPDGVMCAWCYVCNEKIIDGALSTGITEAQMDAIELHKQGHWQDAQQAIANTERPR